MNMTCAQIALHAVRLSPKKFEIFCFKKLIVVIYCHYCLFIPDSRQTSHALSNVFSQLVLGKPMRPDFNAEETLSVQKDKREIEDRLRELEELKKKLKTEIEKGIKYF